MEENISTSGSILFEHKNQGFKEEIVNFDTEK
jgi:hypothetical protein